MSNSSDQYKYTKSWEKKRKIGRIKYGLIYGGIFGILMMIWSIMFELPEFSLEFLTWELVYKQMHWIVFGIFMFMTFMWWAENRINRISKK